MGKYTGGTDTQKEEKYARIQKHRWDKKGNKWCEEENLTPRNGM